MPDDGPPEQVCEAHKEWAELDRLKATPSDAELSEQLDRCRAALAEDRIDELCEKFIIFKLYDDEKRALITAFLADLRRAAEGGEGV